MLRLLGGQVESLFDEVLPAGVGELPADLARLDALLGDRRVLVPVEQAWAASARAFGRPTIPIERFVRLMVIKQRTGWGYEALVREVSDSLHLRRFCRIALTEAVPDESTIRKLCRRLGPEVVEEICRHVIGDALRERRFTSARHGSTRPSSRPTSATPPISGWPPAPPSPLRVRRAGRGDWPGPMRRACAIARAGSVAGCAR